MSGVKPGGGPDRPQETRSEPPPLYTASGFQHGKYPKILVIVACCVLGLMLVLALIFCLVGGVQHKQPRYFLLIINLILSAIITGLLIFWYFRGALVPTMLWYIFVQCFFLFFQCVTTDIFAWYEAQTIVPVPDIPFRPIGPNCNSSHPPPGCNVTTHPTNMTTTTHSLLDFN